MANRIIHEKALRSGTLAKLSAEAERLFWRLLVVADDQGRFDAFPSTVKANCFPRLVDEIKTRDVIAWMEELGAECCKFYTAFGCQYGCFVKWSEYQRIYGNRPKFPPPPAECGELPQISADCGEVPQISAECGELPRNSALILNSISTSTSISICPPNGASPKKGKRAISDEDKPSEKHFAYGQRIGVDVGPEWGKFVNYCKAHDKRYADFDAAFRNWLSNSKNFKGGPHVVR